MIFYVFKPKRRKDGRLFARRSYRGRYRLEGDCSITEVSLHTTDKQVAKAKLAEIVQQAEQERMGLIAPRSQREAVGKPLLQHLNDFLADLKTLGRSEKYLYHIRSRMTQIAEECGFKALGDVNSDRFIAWRSRQKTVSPSTLNHYLGGANAFLNWLKKQNRIPTNPLESVEKIDTRGRKQKRRAITTEELSKLLSVAGRRRVIYLTAIYTGLRRGELRQLVWGDMHLERERPFLVARDRTTKNKKDAVVPIHPSLAEELRKLRSEENVAPEAPVFSISSRITTSFQKDLKKAGIERLDAMGRKLDFHALRYKFATRLAQNGVSPRIAQELMRHSDANLTANVYTDASQLPTYDAVANLPWEGGCPHIGPQESVSDSPDVSQDVAELSEAKKEKTVENTGESPDLSRPVLECQMAERGGFAPFVACLRGQKVPEFLVLQG